MSRICLAPDGGRGKDSALSRISRVCLAPMSVIIRQPQNVSGGIVACCLALSRVCLAPGSRGLFFCLGVNDRCSIFRFRRYRAVCAPLCAPCPSCVLLSFAIHDRFFEKPWFYQVTIRSDLGRACTTYIGLSRLNIVIILISTISILIRATPSQ